jgi:tetratricopeptide (TPR) repeat protein
VLDIGKRIIEVVLLAYLIVFGTLLLFVKADYWSFVDWFVYPTLNHEFVASSIQHVYGIALIILLEYVDLIKSSVLDFSMTVFGYDLLTPVVVLYGILCLLAIINYLKNVRDTFASSLLVLIAVTLLAYSAIRGSVTKSDVNKKFIAFSARDVTGDNYIKEIAQGHYAKVDSDLETIQKKYMSGAITGGDYQYEYDKFKVDVTPAQIEKINDWVAHSRNRALALSARGSLFEYRGWQSRGSKYIGDTSDERISGMRHYFRMAVSDHEQAIKLDRHTLVSYTSLYRIASAGDFGYDRHDISKQGLKVFPESYTLAYDVIEKLEPKWGGSDKEMKEFAKNERQWAHLNPELIALGGYPQQVDCNNYLYKKQYYQAIQSCKRALFYAPRWGVYSPLYKTYYAQKDYKNAVKTIDQYLLYRKSSAQPLLDRAMAYTWLGDTKRAVLDAHAAVTEELDDSQYDRAGWVFEYAHDYNPAGRAYMNALKLFPTDSYAVSRLYYVSLQDHSIDSEVVPYLKHAAELQRVNSAFWLYYARKIEPVDNNEATFAYLRYIATASRSGSKDRDTQESIEYAKKFIKKSMKTKFGKNYKSNL